MKINKIQDIDLSKYKLAYFTGNSFGSRELCQDDVMALIDGGEKSDVNDLQIALIPKEARLTECNGDDWNDEVADDNASGFYEYPKGTIFLKGELGGELILVDNF